MAVQTSEEKYSALVDLESLSERVVGPKLGAKNPVELMDQTMVLCQSGPPITMCNPALIATMPDLVSMRASTDYFLDSIS